MAPYDRKVVLVAVGLAMAASCGEVVRPRVLDVEVECYVEPMREWVADCIRDANPKSDEESEDSIFACETTAIHLFCINASRCHVSQGLNQPKVFCDG